MRNRVSWLLSVAGVAVLAFATLKPRPNYHPVTEAMSAAAATASGGRATPIEAMGTDGRRHSPASASERRPLVLFFIQDGCPCSEAAERHFQRMQAAYGEWVSFLGVIDGDTATARGWSERHGTPYPVLADPERRLIAACKADRSAYVMLVARGGSIEALWPGYSAEMLVDLGRRLARLTDRAEVLLGTEGAPDKLVSGCSF
jgi:peroxiredoxin